MIKAGTITFPQRLFGYADVATQEEAERLSDGAYTSGLVVFIPLSHVTQLDVDRHIACKEDVEI